MSTPSRQALWQRDHHARGLCVLCSLPAVTRNHCAEHVETVRARDRKTKLWNKVKNRRRGRVLCGACGGIGHNARTCKANPAPPWQDRE